MCIAMSRGLVVLLAFAAVAGAQAGNYTCTVEGKVGLTSTNPTCVVAATGGPNGWKEGSTGTISFSGTGESSRPWRKLHSRFAIVEMGVVMG